MRAGKMARCDLHVVGKFTDRTLHLPGAAATALKQALRKTIFSIVRCLQKTHKPLATALPYAVANAAALVFNAGPPCGSASWQNRPLHNCRSFAI
ncbi:hypothetical protein NPIL_459291 [Nephila pilipes]|uniref:Uncharacterized protein n=1 Tax=Nephila pilipes TaxID=299642 RepID=A0A8X6R4R8_NEPPI|nr:hypothetical protein NPIL_459291 [Nephila pilipes]